MRKNRKANREKYLILIQSFVLITAMCLVCHVDVNAKDKSLSENEEALNAYQEFLRGERQVYIEKDARNELCSLDFEIVTDDSDSVFLKDILEQINRAYLDKCDVPKIETISYAYMDCFDDGRQELAVKFRGLYPVIDDEQLISIIVYEKGKLYLRHSFLTWSRNRIDLYYYGFVERFGSDGALSNCREEYMVDDKGKKLPVYDVNFYGINITRTEIGSQLFDAGELYFTESDYIINGKYYPNIQKEDTDIDEKRWNEFYGLYEQKYGTLYTDDEIEELLQKQWKKLGIKDEWKEQKELEWQLLEDSQYKEYVKEIELIENRKEQRRQGRSALRYKWTECKIEKWDTGNYNVTDCYEINSSWRYALEHALTDYSNKSNVSEGDWRLNKMVSYEDGICAAILHCDDPKRDICLILNGDAVKLNLPEYAEYIVAVDFRYFDEGAISWNYMFYDSTLSWISYSEQAKWWKVEQPYTINSSKDNFYTFDSYGIYAMNEYLKRKKASTSMIWNMDVNALCPIAEGRLAILSFSSGNQNVVMVLDDANKKFAVIKGIDE